MRKEFSYVAVFDLDRTVLSLNSGNILVREAYRKGLMKTRDLLNAVFLSLLYKFNLRDTNLIIERMGKWVKGLSVESIQDLSENVASRYLLNFIRPEIIKEIDFHREHNAEIVLLSSAINLICDPVASHLDFNNVLCSEMESEKGFLTGNPLGKFCFREEKRIRLTEFCREKSYNLSETWYYADSIADSPVFDVVGHQVCINPDNKLRRMAKKNGWKILNC